MISLIHGSVRQESATLIGNCGLPPSALPGISPTRRETGRRRYHRSIRKTLRWAKPNHESISPLVGEMPGRTEGGEATPAAIS